MPNDVSVETAEPGSSASTLAYRAAQREPSCGPSSRTADTAVGAHRSKHVGQPVALRKVFADEKDERHPLAEFHDLDHTGRDLYSLPPTDVRVKHPAEVVLVDLSLIQRPAIELVLANVKPLFAGGPRVSSALL
jgi:hypothetical protein